MSLINQMLRDLDSRSRKEGEPGARVTTVNRTGTRSWHGRLLAAVFLGLLLAVGGTAWWYLQGGGSTERVAANDPAEPGEPGRDASTPTPRSESKGARVTGQGSDANQDKTEETTTGRAGNGAPVAAAERPDADDTATDGQTPSWVRDFSVEDTDKGQILRMTLSGDLSHRMFTLPDPYRIVLDVRGVDRAEGWSQALGSLEGVKDARANLRRGDRFRMVLEVAPGTPFDLSTKTLDGVRRRLSLRITPAASEPTRVASASQSVSRGATEQSPEPDPEPAPEPSVKTRASSQSSKPDNVKRRLSPAELADRAYRSGYQAMQAGRPREAEGHFREALKYRPEFDNARRALIGALDRQGRWESILTVAREGMRRGPDRAHYAKIHARVAVERGDLQGAIETLRRYRDSESADAEYRALLAALYRRADRHSEAVAVYRELLSGGQQRAVWWMGLGLSLEALDRPGEALDAYRRAGEAGDLPPDVSDYVSARINALSETGDRP